MNIIGDGIVLGAGGETAKIQVTGVAQTDNVTCVKDGKSYKGKWVIKPNPATHGLPDGYTELDYIQGTGTQYIDTGFKPNQDSRVVFDHIFLSGTKLPGFGAAQGYKSNAFEYSADLNGDINYYFLDYGGESLALNGADGFNRHVIDFNKNTVYRDENLLHTFSKASFTAPVALCLGVLNRVSGGIYYSDAIRMYSCMVYDNDVLVRNFVPAKRNSDNAIGLYDLVTNTFYNNSGTGTFIAGEETPATIEYFEFTIKDYGTYTITATDGTTTKTQDVLVDAADVFNVEINYKFWLYRDGDECEDVTGGWSFDGWSYTEGYGNNQKEVKNKDNISVNFSSGSGLSIIGTQSPIDTSKYTKVFYLLNSITLGTYGWSLSCGAGYNKTPSPYTGPAFVAEVRTVGNNIVHEVNISGATNPLYFSLSSCGGSQWEVKRIWLE